MEEVDPEISEMVQHLAAAKEAKRLAWEHEWCKCEERERCKAEESEQKWEAKEVAAQSKQAKADMGKYL